MKTVEEIQKLRRNSQSIYDLFLQKIPKWNADQKRYDKTGWGFDKDSRFNACKPFLISFSSWMGVYGDSGCSSECHLDDKLFEDHLIKYLNWNKETVMLAIAKQIDDEAKSLKSKAEAELNAKMDELKQLENI